MELKPCPFCRSQNVSVDTDIDDIFYWVSCDACGAEGPQKMVELDAIEAWNHRAELLNKPLTLDELRQMDGEPVWCDLSLCEPVSHMSQWAIVRENESEVLLANGGFLPFVFYGRTWIAYRRKPERPNTARTKIADPDAYLYREAT